MNASHFLPILLITWILAMKIGFVYANSNDALTAAKAEMESVMENLEVGEDEMNQQLSEAPATLSETGANDTTAPASQISTERCPQKIQTYSSKLEALQNAEIEKRNEIKQLNDQLKTISSDKYIRFAERKMICLETTAANLLPIKKAAGQMDTNAYLRKADHLLSCIYKLMTKIQNIISAARASNNTMKVMKLDSIRGQFANFLSIATTLSQQFAVHENKRKRLEKGASYCEEPKGF